MTDINQHNEDCPCCSIKSLAVSQSLDELAFLKSACNFANTGNLQKVKEILTKHPGAVDNDGVDGSSGYTPLHYAARAGHLHVVRFLIEEAGAKVNAKTRAGGATPLHRACFSGNIEIVRYLLAKGADPNIHDVYGETPANKACKNGNHDIVALLLDANPQTNQI